MSHMKFHKKITLFTLIRKIVPKNEKETISFQQK